MRRRSHWALAGNIVLGLATSPHAQAQSLPDLLKGRWAVEGGDCEAGLTLQLDSTSLHLTDAAGHVDTQRVISRRATGIATRTTASTHEDAVGKVWVYEVLAPGRLSLTEGGTGKSADLIRCPDQLPAAAGPRQIIEAIYARYAASDEPNLPLSSEANVRAFFAPGLADDITAFASHSGRLPDICKPGDPFVPGSFGEYEVIRVQVDVLPAADGTDHAAARVSFRNIDKPAVVSVMLDRTPVGWRIVDVSSAPGQSFRANMAACVAPPK